MVLENCWEEFGGTFVLYIMRKNVTEVLKAFSTGNPKHGETCSTDGTTVYSYALPIARRMPDGSIQVRDRYSTRTTNSQITACKVFLRDHSVTIVDSL